MVANAPSPGPSDGRSGDEKIGWRRRYYDTSDEGRLVLGMFFAAVAVAPFAAAVLADHRSMSIFWAGVGLLAAGSAVTSLVLSGVSRDRPNASTFHKHGFRVGATVGRHPILGALIGVIGTIVALIGMIAADRAGEMIVDPARRIPLILALLVLVATLAVAVAGQPFDRHLEFSPEGLGFRRGHQEGYIPWESITHMQTHHTNPTRGLTGSRIRDGIQFNLADGAEFQGIVPRPRTRFRLQTVGLDVDEDTLYNVIDALHAHPELRQLAGREEGGVLFDGPKRTLRKRLRRTEVWLPWERGIHAALADSRTPSGDDDRRDLPDGV